VTDCSKRLQQDLRKEISEMQDPKTQEKYQAAHDRYMKREKQLERTRGQLANNIKFIVEESDKQLARSTRGIIVICARIGNQC
jgi:hypothetical protein